MVRTEMGEMYPYTAFGIGFGQFLQDLNSAVVCVSGYSALGVAERKTHEASISSTSPICSMSALADSRRGSSDGCDFCIPYLSSWDPVSD